MDTDHWRGTWILHCARSRVYGTRKVLVTFLIIIALLGGLTLIFSGIEDVSLVAYMQQWIGGTKNATG